MPTWDIGVANLAHLFSPQVIVVGGGVSRAGELLLAPIRDQLRRYGPVGLAASIQVVGAALGDNAGLAGAAGWNHAYLREVSHG